MDIYSTSFTLPRPSGAVAFAEDALASNVALDSSSSAGITSSIFPSTEASRSGVARGRTHDGPVGSGRMSAMRSRLPPSVKAFMPAAFGGSKRTSERIVEAVGPGAEREGTETETEADSEAIVEAGKENVSSADLACLSGSEPLATKPSESEKVAKTDAAVAQSEQRRVAAKNRDSRSTVGTNSSMDLSSTTSASADSTNASTAPGIASSKATGSSARSPSEPRSTSHSASGSFSAFGYQQQAPSTVDLTEAVQRLSVEAMSSHQCLVSFTAVQMPASTTTLHLNSSSTSLNSDPFHRQGFPSLPGAPAALPFPSQYPYQQYAQGFDVSPMGAGIFGTSAFSTVRPHSQGQSIVSPPNVTAPGGGSTFLALRGSSRAQQYNFHLSGGFQQVMAARGQILRDHPFKTRLNIKMPRNILLEGLPNALHQQQGFVPSEYLKTEVRRRLDEIAVSCKCFVSILANDHPGSDLGFGLETERNVEIIVSGQFEGAEHAKVRIMVMLDELSGLHAEACEIDYKLHNIVGGRKRCVIQTIQEETGVNVYLPTPFSGVLALASNRSAALLSRQNVVYLTGEYFGVQRAKEMLFQVSLHKSKNIISRDTAVLPRKIDWMLMEKIEDLRTIMMDDATFIQLPMLGSQSSVLTVYGDNRISIERSIRSVMQLACQFYIASLWLLPPTFDGFITPATLGQTQMTALIKQVSNSSGAEVVFKGNCFELHGLESEVRQAILQLIETEVVQPFHFEIRFQIELANEHREFISGKKNGKINKIMKLGVRIKFETFNDYNFLIDISSNDRHAALQGLTLLLEELPAEVSFHIPENYHKRIIGVGGKNIQRTMKKFGVYVKFYSKQDLDMETYPFMESEDNVIARTPAKNSTSLENLKIAVMELVSPKDRDFVSETVSIARRYHRTLLSEKGIFIHGIESKLGCTIRFPPPESATDLVSIFGPESQIHIAAQMLLDHVPFEAEYRTPNSVELERLLSSHEFNALVERVKRDLNINIAPTINRVTTTSGSHSPRGETVFKLRLNRSNADFLPAAKDTLEDFLVSRSVEVYESQDRQRSDSFASSFPHFANKLISTVPQAAESTDSFQTDSAARYHQQQQVQEHNRLRAAASTSDIKALFDSPHTHQGRFFPSNATAPPVSVSMSSAAPTTTVSPLVGSAVYTSPYQDGSRSTTSLGGDVWGAPRFLHRSSGTPAGSTSSVGHGIAFPASHNTRLSDDTSALQMTSGHDLTGRGMGLDDTVKALRKPRSFSHRTQSLDIGALAAQQVVQQAIAGSHENHRYVNLTQTTMNTPASTSPSFSTHQRPFGAIGSAHQTQATGGATIPGVRGSSADYTSSMSAFAPLQAQSQPHPASYSPQQSMSHLPQQYYYPHQKSSANHPQQPQQQPQPQQQHHHHHHAPSPSISRLAPSAVQRAPEPETADEVLRSLAQLHFPASSS